MHIILIKLIGLSQPATHPFIFYISQTFQGRLDWIIGYGSFPIYDSPGNTGLALIIRLAVMKSKISFRVGIGIRVFVTVTRMSCDISYQLITTYQNGARKYMHSFTFLIRTGRRKRKCSARAQLQNHFWKWQEAIN